MIILYILPYNLHFLFTYYVLDFQGSIKTQLLFNNCRISVMWMYLSVLIVTLLIAIQVVSSYFDVTNNAAVNIFLHTFFHVCDFVSIG